MMKIEDVKPGQTFKALGVEYKMLRIAGEVQQPKRNNWGRLIGGTYTGLKVAVKVNRLNRGWWFQYTVFYPGQCVTIVE